VRSYAGVERSVTKDVVREGYKAYTVNWTFNGDNYSILVSISTSDFITYKNENINRAPGGSVNAALVSRFIETTDTSNGAFEYIVEQFEEQFVRYGLTVQEDRVNCIMDFVQEIGYKTDQETAGQTEYWKFPIETLFAQGDCEDLAMLTMSLFRAVLDLPVALLVFWDIHHSGSGHAMAAVALDSPPHPPQDPENTSTGWYTQNRLTYYVAETTDIGWHVDEMPSTLYDVEPNRLIAIDRV